MSIATFPVSRTMRVSSRFTVPPGETSTLCTTISPFAQFPQLVQHSGYFGILISTGAPITALRSLSWSRQILLFVEAHHPALAVHLDGVLGGKATFQYLFGQRVFKLRLDSALQRTRSVHRVEARVGNFRQRSI